MSSEDNVPVNNKHFRPLVTGDKWFNNPKPSQPIIFSQNSGLKVQTAGHKEIDYFNLLVSDSFYNLVIDETNLYAVEILSKSSAQARISHWKDLTVDEFKVFLGLLFHTGTIRLNKLEDYWKTDDLFDLQCFRTHMSRNRFLLILRALHFGHPNENQNDTLFRIQPILNYFNNKMDDIYYPERIYQSTNQ
ncbi:piggyBac transposable element-derived protein 4-like [Myzus persicae]|uniref:piggyBac transposable element-derived protein 4-like n=1 Tax=Myzus persicae TaxID=13164 RepID=UPI000B935C39|nr:piggyBac transposable element-derived protein 4-like [Myzus persicae]